MVELKTASSLLQRDGGNRVRFPCQQLAHLFLFLENTMMICCSTRLEWMKSGTIQMVIEQLNFYFEFANADPFDQFDFLCFSLLLKKICKIYS